ncbi:MAG TPA: GNAT family N-acetyltransferase [Steroidobacteraceae bacterium]|nr:GNAT family N-acetyltransferase [Steroidobacteraceae bacterium]
MSDGMVRVSYLELTQAPASIPIRPGEERISREKLSVKEYLDLYSRVGRPLRWDQRLKMPRSELTLLLESERSRIYIVRDDGEQALGLCEFERFLPEIELKNFGLVPKAQGKGLGSWLLRTALHHEWKLQPSRIWLHTDNWDHPAALRLYEKAGFRTYMVREEPPGDL